MRTRFTVFCSALVVALSVHAGVVNHAEGAQSQSVSLDLGIAAMAEPWVVTSGFLAALFLVVILAMSPSVRVRVKLWWAAIVRWIDAV